ncbi:peptidylprolyl isomerase, partial [Candidatus Thioglobus sp.]|nr:peptidylprolyl isomerase [Candidatus Thioglobus sp.]
MSKFLLLLLVVSLNSAATPNSIIAIVNDHLITRDAINAKTDAQKSKEVKLKAVNQQVDILLQMDKVKELGVKPKPVAINNMLKRVAMQN